MINLVNEEEQEDTAKLNVGRSVSTFRAMGIKVFPPGATRSTSNHDTTAALLESVQLDVKEIHKKAKGL